MHNESHGERYSAIHFGCRVLAISVPAPDHRKNRSSGRRPRFARPCHANVKRLFRTDLDPSRKSSNEKASPSIGRSALRPGLQAIAHPRLGNQKTRVVGIGLDFLPQFTNENPQVLNVVALVSSPYLLE